MLWTVYFDWIYSLPRCKCIDRISQTSLDFLLTENCAITHNKFSLTYFYLQSLTISKIDFNTGLISKIFTHLSSSWYWLLCKVNNSSNNFDIKFICGLLCWKKKALLFWREGYLKYCKRLDVCKSKRHNQLYVQIVIIVNGFSKVNFRTID